MRRTLPTSLSFLLATVLFGCAALSGISKIPFTPATKPGEEQAVVYIFRTEPPGDKFWIPLVSIDGKPVVALNAAEYSVVYLRPGQHTVSLDDDSTKPLTFEAKAGHLHGLGLEFRRNTGVNIGVATGSGLFFVPLGPSPPPSHGPPYVWDFIENVEASHRYSDLKERRYSPAANPLLFR